MKCLVELQSNMELIRNRCTSPVPQKNSPSPSPVPKKNSPSPISPSPSPSPVPPPPENKDEQKKKNDDLQNLYRKSLLVDADKLVSTTKVETFEEAVFGNAITTPSSSDKPLLDTGSQKPMIKNTSIQAVSKLNSILQL
jgi:ABC-type uncharacterized transport system involved in gliding motility auxiliary subunit